jgi:pimeloyl-ACP methyl ester carboxylesterase
MGKTLKKIGKGLLWGVGGTLSAALTAVVGWIFYSRKYVRHDLEMDQALDAERKDFDTNYAGRLSYYLDTRGKGTPLVLLHSINAAPSAYEMKPVFERFQGERPVYALELPGFGFSERSDRIYSPLLFQRAITSFIKEVVGVPADVVALSLSCEFAALSAVHHPEDIRSLVMISPTGFQPPRTDNLPERARQREAKNNIYSGLSVELWNRPFYDLVSSRPSIRYFLNKSFEGLVPEAFVDYAYQTSHQPGAQYAPTYFLSGKLFTPAVRETVYQLLECPVLVLYDRDPYTNFEMLPVLLQEQVHWQAVRIAPTKGLPHWERPKRTNNAMNDFWQGL